VWDGGDFFDQLVEASRDHNVVAAENCPVPYRSVDARFLADSKCLLGLTAAGWKIIASLINQAREKSASLVERFIMPRSTTLTPEERAVAIRRVAEIDARLDATSRYLEPALFPEWVALCKERDALADLLAGDE
jgi:hypothetical protein